MWRPENSDCCPDYFSHCAGHQEEDSDEDKEEEDEDKEEEEEDRLEYQVGVSPERMRRPARCEHGVRRVRRPQCTYRGLTIALGDTVRDNCNNCSCQVSTNILSSSSSLNVEFHWQVSSVRAGCMSVVCTMQQCGLDPAVLRELETGAGAGLYSWHPANYTDIWGLTLLQEIHNPNHSFTHTSMHVANYFKKYSL